MIRFLKTLASAGLLWWRCSWQRTVSGWRRPMPTNCTCDPRFFPDAIDFECSEHGLRAFYIKKLNERAATEVADVVSGIRAVA